MKGKVHADKAKIRRVILFINPMKKYALELGEEIKAKMHYHGIETDTIKLKEKTKPDDIKGRYDIAFSLGGDGTVLSAARYMSPLGVPVFPVNLGTFGFIAGIQSSEWQEVFRLCQAGKAHISRRLMLEIWVERKGGEILRGCCLNEVVISSFGIAKIINLSVSLTEGRHKDIQKRKIFKLGSYRSDGLIISTPTGSTAHSLAAGGPIMDPELEALILNPICPFALPSRPMVLPAEETVVIDVDRKQKSGVILTIDGQVSEKLDNEDRIFLKKAPYYCFLIASGRTGFYDTLAKKFVWAGGSKQ